MVQYANHDAPKKCSEIWFKSWIAPEKRPKVIRDPNLIRLITIITLVKLCSVDVEWRDRVRDREQDNVNCQIGHTLKQEKSHIIWLILLGFSTRFV